MTKKLPLLLACSLCAALLLVACGGATTSNNGNTAANTSNTKTGNTSATATPAATATATTSSTGDKLGIPECDDYIAKYEACINGNVPETARATVRATLESSRAAWRQAAANPASRATLPSVCKNAHDMARNSMAAYKCNW